MKDKMISLLLKKLQGFRCSLSGSLVGKILSKIKLGGLLVDLYNYWVIKQRFHRCGLLGQNINFRVSSKPEVTHIDMAEKLEGQLLQRLINVIQNKDVFYDIGAHIGIISLTASIFGKSKQLAVFAFEPHPETVQRLKENIVLNDVDIKVYQIAMGDYCGQTKLHVGNFGDGKNTIISSVLKDEKFIKIPIITVDRFVHQGHPTPNLVKIDVEGYEMNVLLGMEETLKNNSVRHLFIEVHPNLLKMIRCNEKELTSWLNERDYKIVWKMRRGGEVQYQFTQRIK